MFVCVHKRHVEIQVKITIFCYHFIIFFLFKFLFFSELDTAFAWNIVVFISPSNFKNIKFAHTDALQSWKSRQKENQEKFMNKKRQNAQFYFCQNGSEFRSLTPFIYVYYFVLHTKIKIIYNCAMWIWVQHWWTFIITIGAAIKIIDTNKTKPQSHVINLTHIKWPILLFFSVYLWSPFV